MKNNTMKRVLAGTLAVLTVAAYVPANVGGFLTGSTNEIVASAKDTAIVKGDAAWKASDLEAGDYFEENVELNKATNDDTQVSLTFDNDNFKVGWRDTASQDPSAPGGQIERDSGAVTFDTRSMPNTFTIGNVKSIKYYAKDSAGANAKRLVVTALDNDNNVDVDYVVAVLGTGDGNTDAAKLANVYVSVESNINGVITFERKKATDAGYAISLNNDAKNYIESISYTTVTGDANTLDAKTIKSMGGPTVKDRTTVTIVANALLDINSNDTGYKPVYANGKYTYTFDAVQTYDVKVNKIGYTLRKAAELGTTTVTVEAKRPIDEKAVDYDFDASNNGNEDIVIGSTVILKSNMPFKITDGAIKSQKEDGTFEYEDVTGLYKDGAFTAEFVVSAEGAASNLMTLTSDTLPATIEYTAVDQQITANGEDDDEVKIIEDAPVASFTVTNKTPQYSDAAKKVQTKDANGKPIYTETAIANNGHVSYDADRNASVEALFTIDENLLGKSGNGKNEVYKIEVSNGTKVIDTYTYVSGNNVVKATATDETSISEPLTLDKDSTATIGIKMKNAGTYNIKLTVWPVNNTEDAKSVSLTYTIDKVTNVVESDFTLRAFYGADKGAYETTRDDYFKALNNTEYTEAQVKAAKEALDSYVNNKALKVSKNASGVYEVGAQADEITAKGSVTLYAELGDGTECEIVGTKQLGTIGETSTNTKLAITDTNFKVTPIAISWTLVEAAVDDAIKFDVPNEDKMDDGDEAVAVTYADMETIVRKYLTSTNDIDVSKAIFKYSETEMPEGLVDIDALNDGLPIGHSDSNTNEIFYIYAYVDSLETVTPLKVKIAKEVAKTIVQPVLNKTEFTYGEIIKPEDFVLVDNKTGKVVEGLAFKGNTAPLTTAINSKYELKIQKIGSDGNVLSESGSEVENKANYESLIPGKYRVTMKVNSDDVADALNQNNYTFVKSSEGGNNTYVDETHVDIEVKKKALDGSMFNEGSIISKPINANTGIAKLENADLNGKVKFITDTNKEDTIAVKVDGKISTADEPGTYVAQIAVNNSVVASGSKVKWTDLYEGTVDFTWAAEKADAHKDFKFDYEVNATDYTHDNIYEDKGNVYIHAEAKLTKNDGTALTADDRKKFEVEAFGFVYEKEGLLKDLTNTDVDEATKTLQLGVCKATDVGAQKNSDGLIAGINSTVTSIDDYIWVRPYVITTDGAVVYGTARRLDFTTVANKVIAPTLRQPELVGKTVSGKSGIYYYAYASKNTKDDVLYRTADPKAFGVVISREGNYTSKTDIDGQYAAEAVALTNAYTKSLTDADFYFDERDLLNPRGADDKKKAFLKQYYAELKKAYNLTLDSADVSSKAFTSSNYTSDECGTLIRITDSLSRVYVRTYVDFGNGLVVYSEPKSIENANGQLANAFDFKTKKYTKDGSFYMGACRKATESVTAVPQVNTLKGVPQVFEEIKLDATGITDEAKQNQPTEFGLIIDKDGKVVADNYDKSQFILGAGFREIHSANPNASTTTDTNLGYDRDGKTVAFGAVTSNTANANKVSVRAYMVYKGVTLYGEIQNNKASN